MLSCPYIGHLKKKIKMVGDKINLNWLKKIEYMYMSIEYMYSCTRICCCLNQRIDLPMVLISFIFSLCLVFDVYFTVHIDMIEQS